MSTHGQFNSKNPTIKRILKEAAELSTVPSPDYHASPSESNLFEWHFTIRGPPAPSPYASGLYHGRIVLPPTYPLRPPSFRFLTPSGRFEPNREICLSISGHHEESWQPAWGIRTALVAIRSFMDSEAKGQLGGIDASVEARTRLAGESKAWRCAGCGGKSNGEIMREREEEAKLMGEGAEREKEVVPEELRLGYRDEVEKGKDQDGAAADASEEGLASGSGGGGPVQPPEQASTSAQVVSSPTQVASTTQAPVLSPTPNVQHQRQAQQSQDQSSLNWLDIAIGGLALALGVMILRKLLTVL